MKFCPVVPEICRGQVHGARKERIIIIIIIIIIIRNGAKTISLQTLFGRLNKKRSKNNKSRKLYLGDLITTTNHCLGSSSLRNVNAVILDFQERASE
jgi:hypothetical protein